MTEEQREKRKYSATSGKIKWIKDHYLRTKDDNEEFVFISYKSDDYEKVLDDIVYNTCKKYGLKVYFDTAFDDDSDSWITQYYENMCDDNCKAFIAFIDNEYYSSYACLLEMMSRKTLAAGGDYKKDSLFFLPINLERINEIVDKSNTGLGTSRFSDGKKNINASTELRQFNEVFREIADEHMKNIYKRYNEDELLYDEATDTKPAYGKVFLTVTQCRKLMESVIPKANENDGKNKDFVEVIHDKLVNNGIGAVFEKVMLPKENSTVTVINNGIKTVLTVKNGTLIPKQKEGVKEGYRFLGWYDLDSKKKWDFLSDVVKEDMKLEARWEVNPPTSSDGYTYIIFGKEYTAGKGEQGQLMFDAFEALITRYPECAEKLTKRTSIAKAEDVENPGTKDAKPVYFKGYKEFSVNGQKYLVGTSYGFDAKLSEIKGMFKICGVSLHEFVLNGNPLGEKSSEDSGAKETETGFIYKIFEKEYTASEGEQGKLMFDVFEALVTRCPECAEKLTKRTSIAKAEDVENPGTKDAKPVYFKGYKEFNVNGQKYLVGTSYGFDAKLSEIKGMFKICGVDFGQFVIISSPEKKTRNTINKKDLRELL